MDGPDLGDAARLTERKGFSPEHQRSRFIAHADLGADMQHIPSEALLHHGARRVIIDIRRAASDILRNPRPHVQQLLRAHIAPGGNAADAGKRAAIGHLHHIDIAHQGIALHEGVHILQPFHGLGRFAVGQIEHLRVFRQHIGSDGGALLRLRARKKQRQRKEQCQQSFHHLFSSPVFSGGLSYCSTMHAFSQ